MKIFKDFRASNFRIDPHFLHRTSVSPCMGLTGTGTLSNIQCTPLHRENRENWGEKLSRKTQGIWKFCQNTGTWSAQVVQSLILKVKDISIFAEIIFIFFKAR